MMMVYTAKSLDGWGSPRNILDPHCECTFIPFLGKTGHRGHWPVCLFFFFFSLLIRVIEILGTRLLDIVAFIKCDPCDQVDTLQTSVQVE